MIQYVAPAIPVPAAVTRPKTMERTSPVLTGSELLGPASI